MISLYRKRERLYDVKYGYLAEHSGFRGNCSADALLSRGRASPLRVATRIRPPTAFAAARLPPANQSVLFTTWMGFSEIGIEVPH
jgi:hypothetical protein